MGQWHLGSDPEHRSPVDFGFDEAVWSPRTADEVFWTMQSYFRDGEVTAKPYAGEAKVKLEPSPIYSRKKGARPEVLATYDAEFRAGFDRKITEWACDFMARSKEADKPSYVYLPYTQPHSPPIPDPEYAGKTLVLQAPNLEVRKPPKFLARLARSPTGSAKSRRATNASTCADARSSHCASSTKHSSGRSSAASESRVSTASPTRNRSGAPPPRSPNATPSASCCGAGSRSRRSNSGAHS